MRYNEGEQRRLLRNNEIKVDLTKDNDDMTRKLVHELTTDCYNRK